MSHKKSYLTGPDGTQDRAFWDSDPQHEFTVQHNSYGVGMKQSNPNRMKAEERLEELGKKRNELIGKEQENLYRALPESLRKQILHKVAEYELQLHPELFSTPELDKINEEFYNLRDMIFGHGYPDHREEMPHPYPALMGIHYKRLAELEFDLAVDKAVT